MARHSGSFLLTDSWTLTADAMMKRTFDADCVFFGPCPPLSFPASGGHFDQAGLPRSGPVSPAENRKGISSLFYL